MKILFPLLAVLGGITIAIQGQINGGLGKKVGVIEASFISFGIGTLALLFIVLFAGNGNISAIASVPKWQLIGGLHLCHRYNSGYPSDWSGSCLGWGYRRPDTDWGPH